MFLIIDDHQAKLNKEEMFIQHGRTMSYCYFVVALIDKENGLYEVLKERYGKYNTGDIISEGKVFDHCWYIMGMSRKT